MRFKFSRDYFYVLPALVIILVIGLFPLCFSIYATFVDYSLVPPRPITFVGGKNYVDILTGPFLRALGITVSMVAACLALEIAFGFIGALLFTGTSKIETAVRTLISGPILLSSVVVGMLWKYLYFPVIGPVTLFLKFLGVPENPPIDTARTDTALISIIIADVWQWTPLVLLIFLSGILAIPKELLEAAEIDGMPSLSRLRYIIIPNMGGVLTIVLLLRGTMLFTEFDKIFILTKGGPGVHTMNIVYKSYEASFGGIYSISDAATWSIFVLIIINIFVLASAKMLARGLRRR